MEFLPLRFVYCLTLSGLSGTELLCCSFLVASAGFSGGLPSCCLLFIGCLIVGATFCRDGTTAGAFCYDCLSGSLPSLGFCLPTTFWCFSWLTSSFMSSDIQ